jgi:hypothetical protein
VNSSWRWFSKEWLASTWGKAEVDAARLMGRVISALIGIDKNQVPVDLTSSSSILPATQTPTAASGRALSAPAWTRRHSRSLRVARPTRD